MKKVRKICRNCKWASRDKEHCFKKFDKNGFEHDKTKPLNTCAEFEMIEKCFCCEKSCFLSDLRKEINVGYLCKECVDGLENHGMKLKFEE